MWCVHSGQLGGWWSVFQDSWVSGTGEAVIGEEPVSKHVCLLLAAAIGEVVRSD